MMRIAIPHSVLEEATDEREAVRKIGYLGRAAAIFRATHIYIYTHKSTVPTSQARLLRKYLEYMTTPPYLRKDLFPLEAELRLAGLLPPLRLPIFSARPRPSAVLMGLVVKWEGYSSILKVGNDVYAKVPKPHPIRSRLLVQLENEVGDNMFRAHVVPFERSSIYPGFTVEVMTLKELIKRGPLILTGKEGQPIGDVMDELAELIKRNPVIMFGSPRHGVDEIMSSEGLDPSGLFINFIPRQGVETVRTEEAMLAVLSIINILSNYDGINASLGSSPPGKH